MATKPVGPKARSKVGKTERDKVARSELGAWEPAPDRPDPVQILVDQGASRVQKLLPIRYGRMSDTPFRFYRGAAAIMAGDLGSAPSTTLMAQACGDAHITNFGIFATPERRLIFDLNDFDETLPAPFEWDVKRLATSIIIAGRENGFSAEENRSATAAAVREYRETMREFSGESTLDCWYESLDVHGLLEELQKKQRKRAQKRLKKIGRRTSLGSLDKLTEVIDGERRIKEKPHLVERIPRDKIDEGLLAAFEEYRRSLPDDRRVLARRFDFVDMAFKVVGVGSVGTRAWIMYMEGQGPGDDPLFLQFKEAGRSVLEPYSARSHYQHQGHRVVAGQRIMQAASDIFLGWTTDSAGNHYYVRQLRDWKGSPEPEDWDAAKMERFARACGWTLARAHARSQDPALIGGYLGGKDTFDEAIVRFAEAYADQNERDHERLLAAIESGEIEAQTGI